MATNGLYEEVVIAGFGGQGVILAGKLLAQTAMMAGKEVTYMPSYGAEVRGGTANCMVVISDKPVACPVVTKPSSVIVLNKASFVKFAPRLQPGGLMILNSSLVEVEPDIDSGIDVVPIPVDDIAVEIGSPKIANMVALGAYLEKRSLFGAEAAGEALPHVLAKRHHGMLGINIEALKRGAEFTKSCTT